MSTGIKPCESFTDKFSLLKDKKEFSYLVMAIHNKQTIEIEEEGPRFNDRDDKVENKTVFEELMRKIGPSPKYILFDFLVLKNNVPKIHLILISWCPDDCPALVKMPHAGSLNALKMKTSGVKLVLQASEKGDLDYETVYEKALSGF